MRRALTVIVVLLAMAGLAAVVGLFWVLQAGIGAREEPGRFETTAARALRSIAIPGEVARRQNPVTRSDEVLHHGMEHFADHCAVCHGNNGSGDTLFGRGMYPRPPDLRLPATQELSDGEIFYIIENGVKFTGMPGFGAGEADTHGPESSWGLVHFIRHLPRISDEELAEMEQLNPRTPEEWRQMEEERKFLEGDKGGEQQSAKPHIHKKDEGGGR